MKYLSLRSFTEGLWVPTKPNELEPDEDDEDDELAAPGGYDLTGGATSAQFLSTSRFVPLSTVLESGGPLLPMGGGGPTNPGGTMSANVPKVPTPLGAKGKRLQRRTSPQYKDVEKS